MPAPDAARDGLLDALAAIARAEGTANERTTRLREAVLAFASATPDNLSALDRIGVVDSPRGAHLALTGTGTALADIAHALEDLEMPGPLRDLHPDLTPQDWDAFTRLTTLIHVLLCPERPAQD